MMSDAPCTIGQLAQTACVWEVMARKAGNVCPGRESPALTVDDFLKSAAAIAPVLDLAPRQPLGITILRCIEATRAVLNTNTNLGIVMLLAPLASVQLLGKRRLASAAHAVSHDDDFANLEHLDGEFERRRNAVMSRRGLERWNEGGDIAHDEHFARPNVEDLRRVDAAVGAGDYHHAGLLPFTERRPPLALGLPAMFTKPAVALQQFGEFGRGNDHELAPYA